MVVFPVYRQRLLLANKNGQIYPYLCARVEFSITFERYIFVVFQQIYDDDNDDEEKEAWFISVWHETGMVRTAWGQTNASPSST